MGEERETRMPKVQKKHAAWTVGTIIAAILAYPGFEAKLQGTDEKLDVAYAVLQKEVDHINDSKEKLERKVEMQSKILLLLYFRMGGSIEGMGVPGMGLGAGFGLGGGGGPSSEAMAFSGAPAAPDVDTDSDTDGDSNYDTEEVSKPGKATSIVTKKGSASMIEELLVEVEQDDEEERPELPDDIDSLVQSKK